MRTAPPYSIAALVAFTLAPLPLCAAETPRPAAKPNIVFILCDDLGYGDVRCLNPQRGKIATPHADRLAAEGMVFSDAHSGSSVCTPTRYGVLTGRYAWRTKLQSGVLMGDSPPLIDAGRLTVPKLLKEHGYATAAIGKWHLGMKLPDAKRLADPIRDGPTTRGFDHFYGISASLDMPPFAYIENDRYTEAPTATKQWLRKGPAAPGFEAIDVLPTLARKAVEYIARQAAARKPFFLYLALTSPHTPIVPTKQWQGKSPLGPYGDFVMETDWALGQVTEALDKAGLSDNTLVIFTSDNGCAPYIGVKKLEAEGHFPSAELRGYKADIWDGGHRVPFIVRWPAKVKPGTTCRELASLVDLLGTCAEIVGAKLPEGAGEDSFSLMPLLSGGTQPVRQTVVNHSINGRFAIRDGRWKLILGAGSGGWGQPNDAQAKKLGLPAVQLYDMSAEPGEQRNLQAEQPEVVKRLTELLSEQVARGRTTPGTPQKNDVPVRWK